MKPVLTVNWTKMFFLLAKYRKQTRSNMFVRLNRSKRHVWRHETRRCSKKTMFGLLWARFRRWCISGLWIAFLSQRSVGKWFCLPDYTKQSWFDRFQSLERVLSAKSCSIEIQICVLRRLRFRAENCQVLWFLLFPAVTSYHNHACNELASHPARIALARSPSQVSRSIMSRANMMSALIHPQESKLPCEIGWINSSNTGRIRLSIL